MDHYHIWVDLKDSARDLEFAQAVRTYLDHLAKGGLLEGFSLTRRKLGLGPEALGEFHIDIQTKDLAQLDRAFTAAAARSGVVESFHKRVYEHVSTFRSALYRDFPDPVRARPSA